MNTWSKVGCCLAAAFASLYASVSAGEFPYADYERLEYVHFTGSQYFDTGLKPTLDPGYEIDVDFAMSSYVENAHLFATECNAPYLYASWSTWKKQYIWGCSGKNRDEASEGCPAWTAGRHTVAYNRVGDKAVVYDGTVLTTGDDHASSSNLRIGRREATTFVGDVYSFSVTNHSTVAAVIDYVPARERTGDKRVGFWDLVNETFVPAASGTPEAGPVIPPPDEPAVGSVVVGAVRANAVSVTVEITTGKGHETATIELSALREGDEEPVVLSFPDKATGSYDLELSGLAKSSQYQLTVIVDNGVKSNQSVPVAFKTRAFDGDFPYDDYQKLEYVRLTGSQYFATGVIPLANPGYQVDFSYYTETYVNDGHVFGTDVGNSWLYASWGEYNSHYIWGCNGSNKTGAAWEQKFHEVVFNRINDFAIVLDGEVIETDVPHASTKQIKIGQRQSNGAFLKGRIYTFTVIDHSTGQKVIDYIPARERTGGRRVGFVDLVNGEFVPAADNGTPEAGPVIQSPEEPTLQSVVLGAIQPDSAAVSVEMTTGEGHETATITLSALKSGDAEPVVRVFEGRASGVNDLELFGLVKSSIYQLTVVVDNGRFKVQSEPMELITPSTPTLTTYTWVGGADAAFENPANWEPNTDYPHGKTVAAVLSNPADGELVVTVSSALDLGGLSVGGGDGAGTAKLLFANGLSTNAVAGDVNVFSGGTLAHEVHTTEDSVPKHKLNLKVGGNMVVAAGGRVSGDLGGFARGGPGSNDSNGGAYGGCGSINDKAAYGSVREPTDLGSNGYVTYGWKGGGAVMLDVAGLLIVEGAISADGPATGGSGCGGSGGSVLLKAGTLAGAGMICADSTSGSSSTHYAGSGGRIAVYQREAADWSAFTGEIHAFGGASAQGSQGACGTIFKKLPGQAYGELVVDGGPAAVSSQCIVDVSSAVTGFDEPFDDVTVKRNAQLLLGPGVTLKVTQKIDALAGLLQCADDTAAVEFVGDADATWLGCKGGRLANFRCTVPGKKIYFSTASAAMLTMPEGANLVLKGGEGAPLELLPLEGAATWLLNVHANAHTDIEYVSVSNSNASVGSSVLAIDSHDLGGNSYWGFSERIVPGQTNVWTGASSTSWGDTANWSRGRGPVETDVVRISGEAEKMPTIPSGDYRLNRLIVEEGATLTLNTANLTVTNKLSVQGALVCTGTEPITVTGDIDFSGGACTPAKSKFVLAGDGDQTADFDGLSLNLLQVEKSGGSVAFTRGFAAAQFRATPSAALSLVFAAGETVTAGGLYLSGLVGGERLLTLGSSEPGTAWNLVLTADRQQVGGVIASDSNARGGVRIFAGTSSQDGDGNSNWDFSTANARWTGGAGTDDFLTAGNWSPAEVPADGACVTIDAVRGTTASVSLPADHPMTFKRLTLGSGEGQVTFTANSPVTILDAVEVRSASTLVLNSYETPNVVSNDVVIRDGGLLTHDLMKKLNLVVTGDLTVEDGAKIDVNGKGCAPGVAPWGSKGNYGGVYGGRAPKMSTGERFAYCYGSIFEPMDLGCGGDGSKRGAGAIRLSVVGTLTVSGSGIITASGTAGGGGGNSGSGDSIFITCGTLVGSGDIRANAIAKEKEGAVDNHSWTGSGGRVAVYERTARDWSAYTGNMTADGGCCPGGESSTTAPGTVYRETAADKPHGGTITVDGRMCYGYIEFPMVEDGDPKTAYRDATLMIGNATVSLQNHDWETAGTSNHVIRVKDIVLTDAKSKLNLCGNVLKVSDGTHRNGRGWEGRDKANPTVAYEKHVVEDGGTIKWCQGMLLFVK